MIFSHFKIFLTLLAAIFLDPCSIVSLAVGSQGSGEGCGGHGSGNSADDGGGGSVAAGGGNPLPATVARRPLGFASKIGRYESDFLC